MVSEPRRSFRDALDVREFQEILEGASEITTGNRRGNRFLIFVMGRLGLRAGEVAHIKEEWVDWRNRMIEIPAHESCTCGYCKQQLEQKKDHSSEEITEDLSDLYWTPKGEKGVRAVPFDFSPRITVAIERFFERKDEFEWSRKTINRRVTEAARAAPGLDPDSVYPHALRATAASYHAGRGLGPIPLQAFMGWSDMQTAQLYIRLTGEHTARALREIHMQ